MRTLNNKMNQVAHKIGLGRLADELEYNGYLVAYMMYQNDLKVQYSEELNELLNDLELRRAYDKIAHLEEQIEHLESAYDKCLKRYLNSQNK